MKIHDLIQGTPEWAAHRASHFNASDAPAMLGVSPYKSRAELLRETHTGVAPEIDAATAKRFANGHRLEALARPLAEEIIGEELYPVTGSDGKLSASFDGLTMEEQIVFEHKALNAGLVDAFRQMGQGAEPEAVIEHLPSHYRAQMEQQLMVSGADRALFMATNFDAEGSLIEERHCWYFPDDEMRASILRGWAQFEKDLAAYTLAEPVPAAPVGKAPETLPALRIEVTGEVTASNLAEFKETALATIRSVNRELRTDADFADAEKAVKWCADVESRLKAAKEHALSQTSTIDALFKALDDIGAEARTVRLDLDKLVARRKLEVKEHAIDRARRALDEHIAHLNSEIAPLRMRPIAADFAGAIKGLKSVESIQDRLDTLLATTKITADADARGIRENVATFKEHGAGFEFLFADLGQVVHKAGDDFKALVQGRIAQHKVDAAEREKKRMEDAAARDAAHAAAAAAELAAQQADAAMAEANRVRVAAEAQAAQLQNTPQEGANRDASTRQSHGAAGSESPNGRGDNVAPALSAAPVFKPEPATLKLGEINARLAPLRLDAAGLSELGINPARTEGAAKLYRESDFERVLRAIVKHIDALQAVPA